MFLFSLLILRIINSFKLNTNTITTFFHVKEQFHFILILPPFIYFAVAPTVVSEIHILPSRYLYVSKPILVFIILWTHFP